MLSRQDPPGGGGAATGAPLFLGIDFGTSGARYALIDRQGAIHSEGKRAYAPPVGGGAAGWASSWQAALFQLLGDIPRAHRPSISSISIDGTSATTLIVDRSSSCTDPSTPSSRRDTATSVRLTTMFFSFIREA